MAKLWVRGIRRELPVVRMAFALPEEVSVLPAEIGTGHVWFRMVYSPRTHLDGAHGQVSS